MNRSACDQSHAGSEASRFLPIWQKRLPCKRGTRSGRGVLGAEPLETKKAPHRQMRGLSAPGRIRTLNLLIRSQVLYPIELPAQIVMSVLVIPSTEREV